MPTGTKLVSSQTSKSTASATVRRFCTCIFDDVDSPLVAGRTVLHAIISSLERIAFNGDPLQFLLIQTTYQPFISLLHQFEVVKDHPQLNAIRMCI